MANDPNPSAFKRLLDGAAGPAIGVLFFAIVFLITTIAIARSKSPWDTAIAAGAAVSQAFFAYVVWRLGKTQFAFTQRVTDRQHKIDAYPLRSAAINALNKSADKHLYGKGEVYDGVDDKFRRHHVEIVRLFSNDVSTISFELSEIVYEAVLLTIPRLSEETPAERDAQFKNLIDLAFECYIQLEELMEEEMRIH